MKQTANTTERSVIDDPSYSHRDQRDVSASNRDISQSCILVVTNHSHPANSVMEYVISVAGRLNSKIILACVNTRPLLQEYSSLSKQPISAIKSSAADHFRVKAESKGIAFKCIGESGKIGKVVNRLCHIIKRVEFVVIDQGIKMEEVTSGSPVPVFSVVLNETQSAQVSRKHQIRTFFQGDTSMKETSRRTYLTKTLVFGTMTAALYAAVFHYTDTIMHYWTKGGIYCLLPVATVFVFSYAHGSFTGNFWSALGIEGSKANSSKQKQTETTVSDTAKKRPDTRPRLQARV